jgi:hypothetical protein
MLNQNQSYVFAVDPYPEFSFLEDQLAVLRGEKAANPFDLRDVWVNHLRHQQALLEKEEASRHPLAIELYTRKFFVH